jgi:phosphonate metabolism protein PhnN/1,5-bisphosphokinase (PRPP-forming)
MMRYALYFAPPTDSPWWSAGCRWLGRDAVIGTNFSHRQMPGAQRLILAKLTSDARRYGFHATLKAPFRLSDGFTESHLLKMAAAFSAIQRPIVLEDMQIGMMGNFLALRPDTSDNEIRALAMRCVNYFDTLRAAPTEAELKKRRAAKLTERQEELLQCWGYPYTEEEYHFHITLTDALSVVSSDTVDAIRKAAGDHFIKAKAAAPLVIDALTIFREEQSGAPFRVWRRFPFLARPSVSNLPINGCMFFVVGADDGYQDRLLQWVKQRIPTNADMVFARRTLTGASSNSDVYESIDETSFWQLATTAHFAILWQADRRCYGIRKGILADLKAGRDVVVNGTREYVPRLLKLFPNAQVVWLGATEKNERDKLDLDRHERNAMLLDRLERSIRFDASAALQVIHVDDNGPVESVGARMLEILSKRLSAHLRSA